MAKKKATHQTRGAREQTLDPEQKASALSRQSSMEGLEQAAEKLQNLKSLNAMLLKQTVEKRQQMESLVQAKGELEAELARAGTEKSGLREEMSRASEENVGLELEKVLFCAVVESWLREVVDGVDGFVREIKERENEIEELKCEASKLIGKLESERDGLSRVSGERDSIRVELDSQVEEANRLKEKVIRLEKNEGILDDGIGKLKSESERLVKEKKKIDELFEAAMREKDDLESKLKEKKKEIEDLKRDFEGIGREKKEIETEEAAKKARIYELEIELGKLNEIVLNLRKEEKVLCKTLFELEKTCDVAMEKEKQMNVEINVLVKEKNEKKSEIKKFTKERNLIEKQMESAVMESKEKEKLIDMLTGKKSELEECVIRQEAEAVELNREVSELNDSVLILTKKLKDREEKSEGLANELGQLRGALTQAELERDYADKSLDEEKRKGLNLRSKVLEMESIVKEAGRELEKIRNELKNVDFKKKEIENRSELLKNEKNSLEKDLVEAKRAIDGLKAKIEAAGVNSERALVMLKNTASLLCKSEVEEEDGFVREQNLEKDVEPFFAELEAIKNAFRNKQNMMENLREQVESLKHSVEQAHKGKSFWAVVSSATTIFAAASVAYAARVR